MNNPTIRNALGDIGNRIGLSNVQFGALKKDTIFGGAKQVDVVKKQAIQQILVAATGANNKPRQQAKEDVVMSSSQGNNTCIMTEEDEENLVDDQIEVEIEEEDCLVEDIDKYDVGNAQLVAEYVKDVYEYLSQLEKQHRISPGFLDHKIVTSKMRAVLIDWLVQVHLKFQLLQETLYLCVYIIDAYLQAVDVPKMQLQLVGVTAMFLASKYEEMFVPAIDDFAYMTDNTYTKQDIRQMEINILKTLKFLLCKPLPLNFLRRFSKAGQAESIHHNMAKYFMELSLHDSEFSSWDPSYLAACSLCLSFKLLKGTSWNKTMEYYSKYKESDLRPGMQKLAKLTLKSNSHEYKYKAASNKYGVSRFMRVSLNPEVNPGTTSIARALGGARRTQIEEIADGIFQ